MSRNKINVLVVSWQEQVPLNTTEVTQQKCRASSGRWPHGGLTLIVPRVVSGSVICDRTNLDVVMCGEAGMSGVGVVALAGRGFRRRTGRTNNSVMTQRGYFTQNLYRSAWREQISFDMNQSSQYPYLNDRGNRLPYRPAQQNPMNWRPPDRRYYHTPEQPPFMENLNHTGYAQGWGNSPPWYHYNAYHPAPGNSWAGGGGNDASRDRFWLPTNLERFRLFESMLRCGVKADYKKYLAIYWLEFSDLDTHLTSPLFEHSSQHAEECLLGHLKLQLEVVHLERLKSIIIMQNASPCSKCAESYLEAMGDVLKKKKSEVQITIAFSSFHWLRRLSCRQKNHQHHFIGEAIHNANRDGLRKLRIHDDVSGEDKITVRTTCYGDWRKLCTALQVPFPSWLLSEAAFRQSVRGQDDHRLINDLQEFFS